MNLQHTSSKQFSDVMISFVSVSDDECKLILNGLKIPKLCDLSNIMKTTF